jgi:hypothetical protein
MRRQITPRATRSHDPQYRLDKQPIIAAAAPGIARLTKAMRFHLRPLGVRQNKSVHPKPESENAPQGNPKSQQTLKKRLDF